MVSQYQDKSILFTFADEFKRKGIFAVPYFVLTFFDELIPDKKLALIRGDIIDHQLVKSEAQELGSNLLNFYLSAQLLDEFVHPFNQNSSLFSYPKYCEHFSISSN